MRGPWTTTGIAAILTAVASVVGAEGFQVVVHSSVEGSTISRSVLASIYENGAARWGNGVRIRPVDQSSQTPVRRAFTREVLGKSLGELQDYWLQRLAVDRMMPPEVKISDEAVLAFVAKKKGAIGYVGEAVDLLPGVKVLTVTD